MFGARQGFGEDVSSLFGVAAGFIYYVSILYKLSDTMVLDVTAESKVT